MVRGTFNDHLCVLFWIHLTLVPALISTAVVSLFPRRAPSQPCLPSAFTDAYNLSTCA